MNSWEIFSTHQNNPSLKWIHYFPIYDRYFTQWKNKSLIFLEIGVFQGGSGSIWSKFFGPMATIIGIDINPDCRRFETPFYKIRIGDQSDPRFLQHVIGEFGIPDIVLDDGSHKQDHILASFEFLYPKMHKNSIYMVEDLHTAYWPDYNGGKDNPNTFINKTKGYIDQLHVMHHDIPHDPIMNNTFAIHVYDSITVFEKGAAFKKDHVFSGNIK